MAPRSFYNGQEEEDLHSCIRSLLWRRDFKSWNTISIHYESMTKIVVSGYCVRLPSLQQNSHHSLMLSWMKRGFFLIYCSFPLTGVNLLYVASHSGTEIARVNEMTKIASFTIKLFFHFLRSYIMTLYNGVGDHFFWLTFVIICIF